MKIFLGADHGGFAMKEHIKQFLIQQGYEVEDKGAFTLEPSDDYPDFAIAVSNAVAAVPDSVGVLFCRSAAGMVIAANKINTIRAVTATHKEMVTHARLHNDANVLALSGDWLDNFAAENFVTTFLTTKFSGEERHQQRLNKIATLEQ